MITGATCSGKTSLSIDLAKKINAEIICADSRSVYKGLDIVSAKPKKEEMQGVKHHLLDIITPDCDFSAGDFAKEAQRTIEQIKKEGKNVIVTGGTWFYIKSLLDDKKLPQVGINKKLREELNPKTPDELWEMLYKLDSTRAQQIHKNNKDKVIRSIEMCIGLNMPISEYVREDKEQYDTKWFMPKIEREELYQRINKRVDIMVGEGLYDEWQKNKTLYPKFFELERGEYKNFDEAVDKIKQRTRNFAKRQLTYFRSNKDIKSIGGIGEII